MSNPPNPLDKYRSYSYHHVLAVADSTLTANELIDSSVLSEFFLNRPSEEQLVPRTTSSGRYIVLINGFTDAQFVIQEVKWSTILAANTPSTDGAGLTNTIETDGEMQILEPRGVRFLNVLAQMCDQLETDPIGLVFVLKTFFVGHTSDNGTDIISNVRPFMFVPVDIQANFDETGAVYTLGFVGLSNGAAKLPYINDIMTSVSITSPPNTPLIQVFETELPKVINAEYQAQKQKLKTDFQQLSVDINVDSDFRSVEYQFDLDPQYHNYKFGTNELPSTANKAGDPILSFTSATTLEEVIHKIMLSSKEVVDEATGDDNNRYIFKITSSIDSTPTTYIVKYHIHRYQQTMVPIDQPETFTPEPGNLIEFDYIFSGKNIDIKTFDIKMELGLAFFQTISTTRNISPQHQSLTEQSNANGAGGGPPNSQGKTTKGQYSRRSTPLFLGGQVSTPMYRNKLYPVNTANFQALLARHAQLENVQCKMSIRGNPQLLDELSVLPGDLANRETEQPKDGITIAPRWTTVPAFTKVNIFMPAANPGLDFAERFWFDGYFQILSIDNIFVNGEFTQDIEMFSLPYSSEVEKRSDENKTQTTSQAPTSDNQGSNTISGEQLTVEERQKLRARKNSTEYSSRG